MRFLLSGFVLFLAQIHAQTPNPPNIILEGDVTDATTGTPIAGARIKLETFQAEPFYAKADAKGHFVFQGLSATNYYLAAESPGYLEVTNRRADFSARFARGNADPNTCVIQPGSSGIAKTTDADGTVHGKTPVSLVKAAAIAGRVTDPDGLPMENARIEILRKVPAKSPMAGPAPQPLPDGQNAIVYLYGGQTNDKGEFRSGQMEAGAYYVRVNSSGGGAWDSSYRSTYYPRAVDLAGAKPLEIAVGQQARADIQIARLAGVRVSGRLIATDGDVSVSRRARITNLALVPEDSTGYANGPFTSGRESYSFEDVLPGRYTLLAVTFDAGGDPFGGNRKPVLGMKRSIEIGDQEMDGVDLTLQPLADLSGTVTFQEGCAAVPVHVATWPQGPIGFGRLEAITAPDGSFVLPELAPGRFRVNVSSPGQRVSVTSMKLGDRDVMKDGIDSPVQGGEPLRIEVGCNPGGPR
jgi:hypothetical protein